MRLQAFRASHRLKPSAIPIRSCECDARTAFNNIVTIRVFWLPIGGLESNRAIKRLQFEVTASQLLLDVRLYAAHSSSIFVLHRDEQDITGVTVTWRRFYGCLESHER